MTDREKLIQQIQNDNSSDKNSSKKILPGAGAHTNYNGEESKCKKYKWYIIGGVVVCLVALIIGLAVGLHKKNPEPSPEPGPTPGPTPDAYNPYDVSDASFDSESQFVKGFLSASTQKLQELNSQPKLKEGPGELKVDVRSIPQGPNNQLISNVSFVFGQVDYQVAMATFTDANNERWSIPEKFATKRDTSMTMRLDMSGFQLLKNPFGFKFTDSRNSGNTLITTEGQTFIMYDKFMQMDMILPSQRLFGLGERRKEFGLTEGTWTLWANGQETPYDDGMAGKQTYGVHPFVLVQTATPGEYMGIYFRNSNAQSPIVQWSSNTQTKFSYITTGGQIEVYFFFKGTAKQIISLYQNFIGLAQLPPFWALGWHAAAYAYSNQTLLQENIDGYTTNKFPLEGVWIDIDYMDGYKDFSVNSTAFPTIKDLTVQLQGEGKKMILIVDAGLSADDVTNQYYTAALQENLLLKSSINQGQENGILTQHVWPNKTVFLDFFDDKSKDVWGQGLRDLHDQIPYDGIWLDMNEATGFCNGECPDGKSNYSSVPTKEQFIKQKLLSYISKENVNEIQNNTWYYMYTDMSVNSTYYLPFIPGRWNLDNMSLSLNATHPSDPSLIQYNTHSLFGHTEGKQTYDIFTDETRQPAALKDKRVFLLSRSTFAGSGQYLNHWLGDNHRTWLDMKTSIAGVMNMQMFGIPLVGPDTCGFFGEPDQNELCGRWVQLATFYPFARQHRDKFGGGGKNEIWRMPEPQFTWAKNALYDRLQWIRHVYTCMFRMHTEGYTCYDPLFFHFPTLDQTFVDVENTFIVGDAIKVSPVLESLNGTTDYQSFFPNGRWVSLKNFNDVLVIDEASGGKNVNLTAPDDFVNAHLMQGSIAIFQDNSQQDKLLTSDMLKVQDITLIMNRDTNMHAYGRVFLDDGETLSSIQNGVYLYYELQHNAKSLIKQTINENSGDYYKAFNIGQLIITDAEDLKSIDTACYVSTAGTVNPLTATFDDKMNTLTITQQNGGINFIDFQRIHYLQKGVDFNMCDPTSDFYSIDADPDLSGANVTLTLKSTTTAARDLQMNLTVNENGVLNIQWNFADQEKVKVPFMVPSEIIDADRTPSKDKKLSDYVTIEKSPITITVKDSQGQDMYKLNGMQLGELYNYIDASFYTSDPSKGLIGLFEQVSSNLYLKDGIYSLWSRDQPDPAQTGGLPSSNMYGTHPILMSQGKPNNAVSAWNIVFNNLAAAQDWRITQVSGQAEYSVKSFATGGMGDLFLMSAATADAVVTLYQKNIVGLPVMVPQWILGWNQCRWGYTDLDTVKEVVQNYSDSNLPLDVQWSDIDYLDRYRDFTFDPVKFNNLSGFVQDLHSKGMRYIPIIDAGISQRPNQDYQAYDDGVANDVFIKAQNGEIFTGRVWPGDAAYPDFMNDKTVSWWKTQLSNFFNNVNFDGLWLDMNEASNFCNGACYNGQVSPNPIINQLPYLPTGRSLETKSMALDSVHTNGVLELDVHSMFGSYEVRATHLWFQDQKQRTMIIERSAYAGTGKFASRWLGDNFAQQEYMGYSVTGVMAHNIIGIPLAGSDICGFIGDTTPELCARWYTLGAFYPFSRNHNNWGQIPQEPWVFTQIYEGAITYFDIIKKAMYRKLHLIRYYYTELNLLSTEGGTFFKPLFFEFNDAGSFTASQEENIMLGSALKLSINSNTLNKNLTTFYYPAGWWCNVYQALQDQTCHYSEGQTFEMGTKAYDVYLYLRMGYIIPLQEGSSLATLNNVRTTKDLQDHPVDLHLLPDCINTQNCMATGKYLNDDGVVFDQTGNVNIYEFAYHQDNSTTTDPPKTLTFTVTMSATATNFDKSIVNQNDMLGSFSIHNAKLLNLSTGTWDVKVTMIDQSTIVLQAGATYDANWDRLIFSSSKDNQIALPSVSMIELTPTPAS